MLCAIYKSKKKPGSYLYLAKRDDFSSLPEALLEQFGKPEIVMMFNLLGSKRLHSVNNLFIFESKKQKFALPQFLSSKILLKSPALFLRRTK